MDLESPTLPILEDLARLHEGVLLLAPDGRIAWMSRTLSRWFDRDSVRRFEDLFAVEKDGTRLWEEIVGRGRVASRHVDLLTEEGPRRVSIRAQRLALGNEPGPAIAILRTEGQSPRDPECEHLRPYLEAALDRCPDPALALDAQGHVLVASSRLAALVGHEPAALRDAPLSLVLPRALPTGPRRDEPLELLTRQGSTVRVLVERGVLRSPDGREIGSVWYLLPCDGANGESFALARKNAELEDALRAVSHDLRSPLVALLGFTRLVRDDYGEILGEKGRHFVQRIEQAARTMEALIHDLLELSRIDPSKVRKTLVDPEEVMRQLHAELKPRLDATGTRLEAEGELPLVHCDRTRLYQVLSNLIGNALEHMGKVPDPRITVSIHTEPTAHCLRVRDNGRGIAAEHHERIFEIFQTVGARPEDRTRTGVGLAIVKKIAETHGGQAWVESAPGRGASFLVRFPRPT
jgi:signal transduction histidine kinase